MNVIKRCLAILLASFVTSPLAAGAERSTVLRLAWLDGPTWYAIAGSYRTKQEAEARAYRLGEPWNVSNADICENYTRGYWIVAAGANSGGQARALAAQVSGAYAKECL